jgi:hypothetical protein
MNILRFLDILKFHIFDERRVFFLISNFSNQRVYSIWPIGYYIDSIVLFKEFREAWKQSFLQN